MAYIAPDGCLSQWRDELWVYISLNRAATVYSCLSGLPNLCHTWRLRYIYGYCFIVFVFFVFWVIPCQVSQAWQLDHCRLSWLQHCNIFDKRSFSLSWSEILLAYVKVWSTKIVWIISLKSLERSACVSREALLRCVYYDILNMSLFHCLHISSKAKEIFRVNFFRRLGLSLNITRPFYDWL